MSTVADKLAKKSTHKTPAKQVRLRLVYIDFWSAVKLSFLAAVALAIVTVVSYFLIYLVVSATLLTKLDEFFTSFTDGGATLSQYVGLPQVMAFAAIVAILNLVIVTVLGAVMAGIYNLAVKVTGGLSSGSPRTDADSSKPRESGKVFEVDITSARRGYSSGG